MFRFILLSIFQRSLELKMYSVIQQTTAVLIWQIKSQWKDCHEGDTEGQG